MLFSAHAVYLRIYAVHTIATGTRNRHIAARRRRRRYCAALALAGTALLLAAPAYPLSALPEVGRCVRVSGDGAFRGHRCVAPSGPSRNGRFEFLEGAGAKPGFFAPTGEASLRTAGGVRVECGSGELHGEWNGRPLEVPDRREPAAAVSLVLHGCHETGTPCQTSAAAPGDITTSQPLVGELGFISGPFGEGPLRIGLDLAPGEPSSIVLTFTCEGPPELGSGEAWTLGGSVIGQLRPPDVMTSTYQLSFKARGAEQLPERFLGEPADTLRTTRVAGAETREEAVGLTLRGERGLLDGEGEEALEFKAKV